MKKSLLIGSLTILTFVSNAQIKEESNRTTSQSVIEKDDDKVFNFVQQKPNFNGGEIALVEYINENLIYPATAVTEKKEGQVVLRFIVSKDSTIRDVKVLRGFDSECDAEAVRLVKSMPKWKPGRHDGKAVNCTYTLPIKFQLKK